MKKKSYRARVIKEGHAQGPALVSSEPISFFGGVDLDKGRIREAGHPLDGEELAGKVLVFPTGKGSTVGSYALYRLAKAGLAPAALVMERCEPIVATGAIISAIPCVDQLDLSVFETGNLIEVRGAHVVVLDGRGESESPRGEADPITPGEDLA